MTAREEFKRNLILEVTDPAKFEERLIGGSILRGRLRKGDLFLTEEPYGHSRTIKLITADNGDKTIRTHPDLMTIVTNQLLPEGMQIIAETEDSVVKAILELEIEHLRQGTRKGATIEKLDEITLSTDFDKTVAMDKFSHQQLINSLIETIKENRSETQFDFSNDTYWDSKHNHNNNADPKDILEHYQNEGD